MTAVTDHACSKQADAITVPDFRQKLLASMQQSGVVDSLAVRELDQSGRAICSLAFLQRLHCLPPPSTRLNYAPSLSCSFAIVVLGRARHQTLV